MIDKFIKGNNEITTNEVSKKDLLTTQLALADFITLQKSTQTISAKALCNKIAKNELVFDCYIQRNLVWNVSQKSLLIDSMIKGYPIPNFYCMRDMIDGKKVLSALDGKQRSNAINDFITGKFALKDVSITLENNDEVSLDGCYFEDLPDDFQEIIKDYNLNMIYFDDLNEEEQSELFYRLNNGSALKAIQKARSNCPCIKEVTALAKNEFLSNVLTEKSIASNSDEQLIIQSYIMLTQTNPCLDSAFVNGIMQNLELTRIDKDLIVDAFDTLEAIRKKLANIVENATENKTSIKQAYKKFITKTHFISMIPVIALHKIHIEDTDKIDSLCKFILEFFGKNFGMNSETARYKENCNSGSGHITQIKNRIDILNKEFEKVLSIPVKAEPKTEIKNESVVDNNVKVAIAGNKKKSKKLAVK